MYKSCNLENWSAYSFNLTHTLLKQDITYYENSVDPNQLASEKPADQEPHCSLNL